MIVLKLGGSVITDKASPETVDETTLDRLARAVGDADEPLVVVHGGGSFGHHHADRHGVSSTDGTRSADAIREIHAAMGQLNDAVVGALARADVPSVPIRPLSAATRDEGLDLSVAPIRGLLDEGFVPVLHGDVVGHAGRGATIVSGDALVAALAPAVDADRVGLCTGVPGVYDTEDRVIETITDPDSVDSLGASDATDVTGGMAAKVETLAALDRPASIFGVDDLSAFLSGERPGTTVE
ncbi:isopentenyl phosphate kinase [Halococcoides cellulosivorans]|uniref:Isopentenyl phosphate kinase n=1 Tax=Halococcoides cellulosivorans TaxID=1679096 RepID=A0A2R4X0F4_9EURY|nr:isopentenyl phosphate kinase [Halococcoides cellulosivorans]AWB27255.1 acetylglutamate kinase [Halococcoides cellulosivorans]